ncbi:Transcription antitermination protein RfaH [Pseudovibrio axinellae]|uniref:Transcription antitermination protein RfaH n=1 Tax=Pseudovibrio axinellae TaxID=989403 RepID=A0A161X7D9_9HYPH|nr:transcription termination/antitermination NusG family protein [Pseudovibrio axinellae]KZL04554.1 Transcription antitermination protein RfaH [Pseudovibrio axinellae]SEQ73278.1 Transcription antitermination factor NusG [Pseudovibrio axinellae]
MTVTLANDERRTLERNYQFIRSLIKGSSLEWVVVQTNPNCEDRAFESIRAVGVIAYLPMMTEVRTVKVTKKRFVKSCLMFPRYLLVGLDANAGQTCDLVRKCDGVEKILSATMEGAPHRVPVRELLRIVDTACEAEVGRKLIKGQLFNVGHEVMLVAGVGVQLKGVVREIQQGGERVRVEVEAFGRTANAFVPIDKVSLR